MGRLSSPMGGRGDRGSLRRDSPPSDCGAGSARCASGLLLCEPDSRHGAWMFEEIMEGGSFGYYSELWQRGKWTRPFMNQVKRIKKMSFVPTEVAWGVAEFWRDVIKTVPERIGRRSFSLHEANKRDLPASK